MLRGAQTAIMGRRHIQTYGRINSQLAHIKTFAKCKSMTLKCKSYKSQKFLLKIFIVALQILNQSGSKPPRDAGRHKTEIRNSSTLQLAARFRKVETFQCPPPSNHKTHYSNLNNHEEKRSLVTAAREGGEEEGRFADK